MIYVSAEEVEERFRLENRPPPRFAPEILQDFNDAAHFHGCRSATFEKELADGVPVLFWRKAVRMPAGQGWSLQEVREYSPPDDSGPARRSAILMDHELSFFEAVEMLAVFEWPLRNPDDLPEELGYRSYHGPPRQPELPHFKELALREGIIFDLKDGLPHPTINGQIVTTGDFSADDMDALAQNAQNQNSAPSALPGDNRHFLQQIFNDQSDMARIDFDGLRRSYKNREILQLLPPLYRASIGFARTMIDCGFDANKFKNARFQKYSGTYIRKDKLTNGNIQQNICAVYSADGIKIATVASKKIFLPDSAEKAYLKDFHSTSHGKLGATLYDTINEQLMKLKLPNEQDRALRSMNKKIRALYFLAGSRHEMQILQALPDSQRRPDHLDQVISARQNCFDHMRDLLTAHPDFSRNEPLFQTLDDNIDELMMSRDTLPESLWDALEDEIKMIETLGVREQKQINTLWGHAKHHLFRLPKPKA